MIFSFEAEMWLGCAVLGLVVGQRLGELLIARRNTINLLRQGALEFGAAHYPYIVALHAAWLAALTGWIVLRAPPVNMPLLILFAGLQGVRIWILWALGPFWTTRVISLPGAPLVKRGPYRIIRHPNYVLVALEIAVLPLAFGAWQIAAVFSLLNAAVLTVRIKVENAVLASREAVNLPPRA